MAKIYTIQDFLDEYDSGDLSFNNVPYRKGAEITSPFGLTEGYRIVDGKMVWDSIRIHSGVDRGRTNRSGLNIVVAPFNFDRSEYIVYGEKHVYGSMLRLFNDKYRFEMRIVHLNPRDILNDVLSILYTKGAIKQGTIIGKCGDFGRADGKHTHTEFVSYDESNIVFNHLLKLKYGRKSILNYDKEKVLSIYKKSKYWKDFPERMIIKDYGEQLRKRHIHDLDLNRFKYKYQDWYYGYGTKEKPEWHTRYSSELLFNGL